MKVQCIDNEGQEDRLTLLNVYEAVVCRKGYCFYTVIDDLGNVMEFREKRFIIVEE